MIQRWKLAWLPVACAWIMSACAGNGPAPTTASSFDAIQQTIFNVNCLSAGCHNSSDQQGSLVLEQGHSFANLVGVVPANGAAAAAGMLRVDPCKPQNSFLLTKLTLPTASDPKFQSRMPLGQGPLSAADIGRIQSWILSLCNTPLPTPPTATPSLPPTATATATASNTASATPTITDTPTVTPTGTPPPTTTPTLTPPPSPTPSSTATASATQTASATPTASLAPTPTFSIDSTFPQIQANIFNTTCLGLGCHNAQDQGGGQNLEPGSAYASLVGVVPQNPAAIAAGMLRVDPGKPANSFLLIKLTLPGISDPDFGSRMPFTKPKLSAAQIDQIRAWILRGALENETGP